MSYRFVMLGNKDKEVGEYHHSLLTEDEMKYIARGVFIGGKMMRARVKVLVYQGTDLVYKIEY